MRLTFMLSIPGWKRLTKSEITMRTYKKTVGAKYAGGWNVIVTFEDGSEGVFDFTPFAEYACYRQLKSKGLFSLVKADHGTLSWPGEIDIAPEAVWTSAKRN